MPYYEYKCNGCERIIEILWEKFDGGPKYVMCHDCGREARKILSTVQHKGKTKGRM